MIDELAEEVSLIACNNGVGEEVEVWRCIVAVGRTGPPDGIGRWIDGNRTPSMRYGKHGIPMIHPFPIKVQEVRTVRTD